MKLLIDMNLSPMWCAALNQYGREAIHWSEVGDPRALDRYIMDWARENGYIVFTHDLDFGTLLALTHAEGPSVIQVRTQDVTPNHLVETVVEVLRDHETMLDAGALISVDESSARVRMLPL